MSRLQEILDIVNATEESSYDDLAELLKPEALDRDSAGEIYSATLGYDPTSYFDKKEISDKVHTLATESDIPEDVSTSILDDEEDIAETAYNKFEERRSDFMDEVIEETITEKTGWSENEEDDEYDED